MNPIWGHVVGVFTVLLLLAFVGICAWAWLPYHRRTFDSLARLPMQDDEEDPS
jgi:cytochrome c oxidase cbb3-type subunit IV